MHQWRDLYQPYRNIKEMHDMVDRAETDCLMHQNKRSITANHWKDY